MFLMCATGFAQDFDASVRSPQRQAPSQDPSQDTSFTLPDWLKRTNYAVSVETDQKPRVYFETVQPLYQSDDQVDTVFTHDRISLQDERGTYSAGVGYRRLFNEDFLGGINTFFDYQDLHRHYRQGIGLEALTKTIEVRANSYFGLSSKRLVDDTTNTYEKAASGGDIEVGIPVPYLPWVKVYGSYYRYFFQHSSDMSGWQERLEFSPYKFTTINFITYDDNKGSREYRMDGRINLAFDSFAPKSMLSAFKVSDEPMPGVDLKQKTLARVERNFNIVVEKWAVTPGGLTIEIGRK